MDSAVNGNAVPHLILYHQHTDFLELLTQFLDVIADNAVVDVHIALVVEHIEGAGYIDFKGRSDILGFLFFLSLKSDFILSLCELIVGGKEGLQPVQKTIIDRCVRLVYQTRRVLFRSDASVNDGFLHRL